MGIEPTNRMSSMRLDGFEDRARHQPWFHFLEFPRNQFAPVGCQALTSICFRNLFSVVHAS